MAMRRTNRGLGNSHTHKQNDNLYLPFQGRVVSKTNLLIHLNKILAKYEIEIMKNEEENELKRPETPKTIFRLDRQDREKEVQDACQVYDLSDKEEFLYKCSNLNIPPFAMTYLMDSLSRRDTHLNMRNLGIGAYGACAVMDLLAGNTDVCRLDLSLNKIGNQGTQAVANVLERNRTIYEVNLSENLIGKDGLDSIANLLTYDSTLTHLIVSRNSFHCNDINFLCNVVQTIETLKFLDLSHNMIRDKGGRYIGDMLMKNNSLHELLVGWNYLGDEGTKYLCSGLKENRTLERLDMCWNEIGRSGAFHLAECIESNGRLVELNIDNNHITDHGLVTLARGLEANETLQVVHLGFNVITAEGAYKLLDTISHNKIVSINTLHIAEVEVTSKFESLFWKIKQTNPRFKILEMSTPGGEPFHFEQPLDPLNVLNVYLEQTGLNIDVCNKLNTDQ